MRAKVSVLLLWRVTLLPLLLALGSRACLRTPAGNRRASSATSGCTGAATLGVRGCDD